MAKVVTTALMRKPALGKGLGALIAEADEPNDGVVKLAVDQVHPDAANPRKHFDAETISELAASLESRGMLQPIVVRRDARGYRIVMGERRFRAACHLGWTEVPVLVKEATDEEAFRDALVENLQREDLNPLEAAEAYNYLLEKQKLTQEQIASIVGKNRSSVANALRLLMLPSEVKVLLSSGKLDMGHARALLSLSTPEEIIALAREIAAKRLSVRDTETRVKGQRSGALPAKAKGDGSTPEARRLVEGLQRRLGTKVRLRLRGGGRGSLEVDFHSYDDLERITQIIAR